MTIHYFVLSAWVVVRGSYGRDRRDLKYKTKSKDEIHRNMAAIRSRDNKTEVALRKFVHSLGLRYRLHSKHVLGKPDIVFPSERVAVFVDGDYWHARLLREKGVLAVRERIRGEGQDYWIKKFSRRVERDDEVTETLRAQGWIVLRFWESEIKKSIEPTGRHIRQVVLERRRLLRHDVR